MPRISPGTTAGLLVWLLAFIPGLSLAQISPGELSRAHQSLEGMAHCTACHSMGKTIADENCLTCHGELAARIKAGTGLHGQFAGRTCVSCHKEHHGRDFELVRLDRTSFDHRMTGFALGGRHRDLHCEQCHQPAKIRATDVRKNASLLASGTFLGLSTDCASCHRDPHQGKFGSTCTTCHSDAAWKPVTNFDHSRTRFPLTGRHATVECIACHRQETDTNSRRSVASLRFDDCSRCHRDVHAGRFDQRCATCHTTSGWQSAQKAFDHARTRFPLRGAHARLQCRTCHDGSASPQPKLAAGHVRLQHFDHCADCHRDPHRGQFADRPLGGACEECHTETSWDVRSIAGFNHASTRFPLRGKHKTVDCKGCHGASRDRTPTIDLRHFEHCADCHQDPHAGQFVARSDRGACESCHTESGFLPPDYPVAAHSRSRFPLDGAHLAVACSRCHQQAQIRGVRVRMFRSTTLSTCSTCHQDIHHSAFTRWMENGCATCHATERWSLIRFQHAKTGFALQGKHGSVACGACHNRRNVWQFAGTPRACASCHATPRPLSTEAGS